METYRCGSVLEPRIHYYFPIKNVYAADKDLKNELKKYNIKREIYKCQDLNEIKQIIYSIQKKYNSEEISFVPEIKECDVCECEYCKEVFTSKYELSIHEIKCTEKEKIINEQKLGKLNCKYCGKNYRDMTV
jgi:redox-regulated HSP33 family molecular chaperone